MIENIYFFVKKSILLKGIMIGKLNKIFFTPVSPVTLGIFRIGFGLIMIYQFFHIQPYFFETLIHSKYFIKYDFFEWVHLTSEENLHIIFNVAIVASFFFTIGLFYRFSSFLVFLIWCYLFFTDLGHNNNHYYLIGMFLFFLPFIQANQWGSVKSFSKNSKLIPAWNYLVFKLLMVVLYFYGAVAKMNKDWLSGYPLKYWLHGRTSFGETVQQFLDNDYTVLFFSYYGLIFDLLIGFVLFHKKYKYFALIFLLPFHISNHFLWPIGVFPWFSIFVTVLFFEEELSNLFKYKIIDREVYVQKNKSLVQWGLVLFLSFQFLFPLRQHLYSGKTNWHGYGEFFAWRMMLTDKQGAVRIRLYNQDNQYLGEVSMADYINERQLFKLVYIPKTFIPFCKYIESEILADARNSNITDVKIYVDAFKTINNRPFQRVIDEKIDLTALDYSVIHKAEYILPFVDSKIKEGYNTITFDEMLRFMK